MDSHFPAPLGTPLPSLSICFARVIILHREREKGDRFELSGIPTSKAERRNTKVSPKVLYF